MGDLIANNQYGRIHVAVAVLAFGEWLLLAQRHAHQDEGGKLEFVGGKLEAGETPKQALMREVAEELGLDIATNLTTKLGRIFYDYPDKSVCLHVYRVSLTDRQYRAFQDKKVGCDGQAIGFYHLLWVVSQAWRFPKANARILTWLSLPETIAVSRRLDEFIPDDKMAMDNAPMAWANAYCRLPSDWALSVRTKADKTKTWQALGALGRADLPLIVPLADFVACGKNLADMTILALRISQTELEQGVLTATLPNLPLIVSCHDVASINKVNAYAKSAILSAPILAVFLSPVCPTKTHPKARVLGWAEFARLAQMSDVPVIALGGLALADRQTAYTHGAVAIAGIRGFACD